MQQTLSSSSRHTLGYFHLPVGGPSCPFQAITRSNTVHMHQSYIPITANDHPPREKHDCGSISQPHTPSRDVMLRQLLSRLAPPSQCKATDLPYRCSVDSEGRKVGHLFQRLTGVGQSMAPGTKTDVQQKEPRGRSEGLRTVSGPCLGVFHASDGCWSYVTVEMDKERSPQGVR